MSSRKFHGREVPAIKILASYKEKNTRSPAFVEGKAGEGRALRYSNKKLYFLTLYKQYEDFTRYLPGKVDSLAICPRFHTDLINYRESKRTSGNESVHLVYKLSKPSGRLSEKFLASHPEFFLPLSLNNNTPTVADKVNGHSHDDTVSVVTKALGIHAKKIYRELEELCEYGNSSGYYIYANLMAKEKNEGVVSHDPEGLTYLLKSMPFVNMLVLESLRDSSHSSPSRAIASYRKKDITRRENFSNALLKRFNARSMESYLENLRQLRRNH